MTKILKSEKVGDMLIAHHENVPEQEVDLIRKIVRDAQVKPIKNRCKACYPCPSGTKIKISNI